MAAGSSVTLVGHRRAGQPGRPGEHDERDGGEREAGAGRHDDASTAVHSRRSVATEPMEQLSLSAPVARALRDEGEGQLVRALLVDLEGAERGGRRRSPSGPSATSRRSPVVAGTPSRSSTTRSVSASRTAQPPGCVELTDSWASASVARSVPSFFRRTVAVASSPGASGAEREDEAVAVALDRDAAGRDGERGRRLVGERRRGRVQAGRRQRDRAQRDGEPRGSGREEAAAHDQAGACAVGRSLRQMARTAATMSRRVSSARTPARTNGEASHSATCPSSGTVATCRPTSPGRRERERIGRVVGVALRGVDRVALAAVDLHDAVRERVRRPRPAEGDDVPLADRRGRDALGDGERADGQQRLHRAAEDGLRAVARPAEHAHGDRRDDGDPREEGRRRASELAQGRHGRAGSLGGPFGLA